MNLPLDIKNQIESLANEYKIRELKKATKKLSDNYLDDANENKTIFNKIDILAYAITRMPATFASTSKSLEITFKNYKNHIKTAIDIGSGTGSGAIALKSIFNNQIKITCLEKEQEMINMMKFVTNNGSNIYVYKSDIQNYDISTKYDLVLSSYMINEINETNLNQILDKMWNLTNDVCLLVEPGTPESYKRMMKIRKYMLDKGAYIIAPCAHQKVCPLKEDDYCNFSVRLERSKLHKLLKNGEAPYEDEKFFFLAFSKNKISQKNNRIIRHPMINKGKISLKLCASNGDVKIKAITKKDKELFKKSKKLTIGDSFE